MNIPETGGTLSGTLSDGFGDFPPDLVEVIAAWPAVPEEARRQVVAIVQAATQIE